MEAKKLIDFIELKDEYACALMNYYLDRTEEDQIEEKIPALQQHTNNVCESWAKNFISMYREELNNKQIQIEIFRYLDSLGVKQGHTGKRFSEALYKQLHILLNSQEKIELYK